MPRERKERENYLIGKFLKKTHPELAKQIADTYIYPPPPLNDYAFISDLYQRFKPLAHDYKWNSKQLFISAIIRLYNPSLHQQPTQNLLIRTGLVLAIAKQIPMPKGKVSVYIRTVMVQERAYDSYKAMVDEVVAKIHTNAD